MTTTPDPRMLQAFDKFKQQIDEAYDSARDSLACGDLERAQSILAQIAQTHARTALSLRNYLIKRGMFKADE